MTFSQKVCSLLIGAFLLPTNLCASTDKVNEFSDAVSPAYGTTAYKAFFENMKQLKDKNEIKTAVQTFIKTYHEDLTLRDFYSYLEKVKATGDVSPHYPSLNEADLFK